MKYVVIINPKAGSGAAAKVWPQLAASLTAAKVDYEPIFTEYSGHGVLLGEQLGQKALALEAAATSAGQVLSGPMFTILIVGGDGTVNHVLNGLHHPTHPHFQIPIAYFPAGSGNDFARSLHLPRKVDHFIQRLQQISTPTPLNVFALALQNSAAEPSQPYYLINNFGMGFDAHVVHLTEHSPWKSKLNRWHLGNLAYVINLISVLKHQQPYALDLDLGADHFHFDRAYLSTLTNIAYFGGGVPIVPAADPHIQELNLIILEKPSLPKFIWLFILMLTNGKHLNSPAVHLFRGQTLKLHIAPAQFGQMDGEDMGAHEFQLTAHNQQYPFWI
ncbi:diacylglycerol/lipid kinase family protein [Lapidilactobacillus achengensis]|uniref:Diacylglycerol/lipid kinase family protein n=1 Tax=Lapidilactobacillus achengensis TaxID=2486000 RepID=A0ABW1UL66_9LACO|nr:diacylglycerol kinase family protein [Lapidilactobacillus achengensis]